MPTPDSISWKRHFQKLSQWCFGVAFSRRRPYILELMYCIWKCNFTMHAQYSIYRTDDASNLKQPVLENRRLPNTIEFEEAWKSGLRCVRLEAWLFSWWIHYAIANKPKGTKYRSAKLLGFIFLIFVFQFSTCIMQQHSSKCVHVSRHGLQDPKGIGDNPWSPVLDEIREPRSLLRLGASLKLKGFEFNLIKLI